ncbi:glycoside hydrolase superfamily [Pilobolus umbonatus]|nr:glycoside hydrolase superfamily [Pilobolus umbonatus]
MTNHPIENDIGQLFMCGFYGLEPSKEILDLITTHNLGSIILFSRNIESREQVQKLTNDLQTAARNAGHTRPLLIAIDQENGVVRRLGSSGTYLPGSMALGAIHSTSDAYQVAKATAIELKALGINWNLAPVMDVNSNPLNPVIGVRSFGEDPQLVARMGIAQVEGYHQQCVVTSLKHFPGHGDTASDSHVDVPLINKSYEELEKTELLPFLYAIQSKGNAHPSSIMISHISLPTLIKEKDQVASLSPEIVKGILRQEFKYEGVVITDCLEMEAINKRGGSAVAAVKALQANNDIVMLCHTYGVQKKAFQLVKNALNNNQFDKHAINRSLERIALLKDRFISRDSILSPQNLNIIACEDHLKLSSRLYDKVCSAVRNRRQLVPIHPSRDEHILFLTAEISLTLAIEPEQEPFEPLYNELKKRHKNTTYMKFNKETDPDERMHKADYVIIATANANLHPFQSKVVHLASKMASNLIVVAVINPYDLGVFDAIDTYYVTYEHTPPALKSFVRLLFGEIGNRSIPPVTIVSEIEPRSGVDLFPQYEVETHSFREIDACLNSIYHLWDILFHSDWSLSFDTFQRVLSQLENSTHLIVYNQDREVVGFAVCQVSYPTKQGQIALIMVHPLYQFQGIGTLLNDRCLEMFRHYGLSAMLGSTYPRFFPGIPNDKLGQHAQAFFKNRGYTVLATDIWTFVADLTHYEMPAHMQDQIQGGLWIGPPSNDKEEILQFQRECSQQWLHMYQQLIDKDDMENILIARDKDENGQIVASLILVTNHSHESSDMVWEDRRQVDKSSGGIACVSTLNGGDIEYLICYANNVLKSRGVITSYIDWVESIDLNSVTYYHKWAGYRLAVM